MGFLQSSAFKRQARAQQRGLKEVAAELLGRARDLDVLRDLHGAYFLLDSVIGSDSFRKGPMVEWRAAMTNRDQVIKAMRIAAFSAAGKTDNMPAMVDELSVMHPYEQILVDLHRQVDEDPELNSSSKDLRWSRASVEALLEGAGVELPIESNGDAGYFDLSFLMYLGKRAILELGRRSGLSREAGCRLRRGPGEVLDAAYLGLDLL